MRSRHMPAAAATVFAGAALLALCGPALAAPPSVGSTHTFLDPVFEGTIVCDTLDAITDIASSPEPDATYEQYVMTANAIGEPVCLAIVPTAEVRAVMPLGTMSKGGSRFNAWAVETDVGGTIVYALYLEENSALLV